MLRIFHNPSYDFIKWWRVAALSTIASMVLGLASFFVTGGVNYTIEFTGGTIMQLEFKQPPDGADLRTTLDRPGIRGAEIQQFGSPREFTIRAQDRAAVESQAVSSSRQAPASQSLGNVST